MNPEAVRNALGALALAAVTLGAPAFSDERGATLTVTGEGSVMRAPDMAHVAIGVETARETAEAAISANSKTTADVIAAAKGVGIDAADIQTRSFTVQPRYAQRQQTDPGAAPMIVGYVIANELSITCRDLDTLGSLLDLTLASGANRVNSVRFAIADESAALTEARRAAVKDARTRAETYAKAAGVELGEIVSITEGAGIMPAPHHAAAEMRMAAAVPVERGTLALGARVTIVWRLED